MGLRSGISVALSAGVWRGIVLMVAAACGVAEEGLSRDGRVADASQHADAGPDAAPPADAPKLIVLEPRISGVSMALEGVATNGSSFVAVGRNGTIVTSSDGVTWNPRASGSDRSLFAVTHRGLLWVAVGDAGTILTSLDGGSWSRRESHVDNALRAVTSAAELFAVGVGGSVTASLDGLTWTPRAPYALHHAGVARVASGLVTVGDSTLGAGGKIVFAPNPFYDPSWGAVASGLPYPRAVAASLDFGRVVVVGDDGSIYTSDGAARTFTPHPVDARYDLYGVTACRGSTFVAIGSDRDETGAVFQGSADGTRFDLVARLPAPPWAVACGTSLTVIVGDDGHIWTTDLL